MRVYYYFLLDYQKESVRLQLVGEWDLRLRRFRCQKIQRLFSLETPYLQRYFLFCCLYRWITETHNHISVDVSAQWKYNLRSWISILFYINRPNFFQLISYCIQPFPCMQARSLRPAESLSKLRQSCLHLSAWRTTPHTYIHFKSLFKTSWCGGIYITHIYSGVIISAEHL